jgi:hypothetical protein
MSTYYYSSLSGPDAVSIKCAPGHVMPNLCFYIRWDLPVSYCIPMCLEHEMSKHHSSCSHGPGVVSIKRVPGHIMPSLCVLHPVGSVGHVVHSGTSEP